MNKYPRHSSELVDLKEAAKRFVLPGVVPNVPVLERSNPIWTIGSCFAENIYNAFVEEGLSTKYAALPEYANSPVLMASFIEAIRLGDPHPLINIQEARSFIRSSQAVVLTLGIGAAIFSDTGTLVTDAADGQWRALTFSESLNAISNTVAHLLAINPGMLIFLTLSPVPINRSLWRRSPVIADCVSKSTLRTAIAEYMSTAPKNVQYWPAFEIVRWLGAHRSGHYGADDDLQRHVSKHVVDVAVSLFVEAWFKQ